MTQASFRAAADQAILKANFGYASKRVLKLTLRRETFNQRSIAGTRKDTPGASEIRDASG